jgi:ferritin
MSNFLSDDLIEKLLDQYVHEKYNASFYLYVAAFLMNKGLNGLAKHFYEQHGEEVGHSLLIFDFLLDVNTPFKVNAIDAIDFPISTITDIAEKYYEREVATTEDLEEELAQAEKDGNGIATEFLRQMVDRQRNEMKEVFDFQDNANLCGDDWYRVKVWSDSIS